MRALPIHRGRCCSLCMLTTRLPLPPSFSWKKTDRWDGRAHPLAAGGAAGERGACGPGGGACRGCGPDGATWPAAAATAPAWRSGGRRARGRGAMGGPSGRQRDRERARDCAGGRRGRVHVWSQHFCLGERARPGGVTGHGLLPKGGADSLPQVQHAHAAQGVAIQEGERLAGRAGEAAIRPQAKGLWRPD